MTLFSSISRGPYCPVPRALEWLNPALSIFLSLLGDTRGPSVLIEAVDVPCQGPLHFSHIADYISDLCPLSDLDVCLVPETY